MCSNLALSNRRSWAQCSQPAWPSEGGPCSMERQQPGRCSGIRRACSHGAAWASPALLVTAVVRSARTRQGNHRQHVEGAGRAAATRGATAQLGVWTAGSGSRPLWLRLLLPAAGCRDISADSTCQKVLHAMGHFYQESSSSSVARQVH